LKELVILSGKGGTGKTSLVGSIAALAEGNVLVDADVDAANLHLITRPDIKEKSSFIGGKEAVIDQAECNNCGVCLDYCRFDAIALKNSTDGSKAKKYLIDPIKCEGCGVCASFCPVDAIEMKDRVSGEWYVSDSRLGPMVHGHLGVGQGNSGKLVTVLREKAREVAREKGQDLIIVDGPPGIGCPAIASLNGADYVLIVTEPTLSAFHDLDRLLSLTNHFKIRTCICINKYDINAKVAGQIEEYASKKGASVMGRINYDPAISKAQADRTTLMEYISNDTTAQVRELWKNIKDLLKDGSK